MALQEVIRKSSQATVVELPPTLKQVISSSSPEEFSRELSSRQILLVRVSYGRNGISCLRKILPEIWGQTFVFSDRDSARNFLLSLEGIARNRCEDSGTLGGVVMSVRHAVSHLIETHHLQPGVSYP